MSVLLEEENFLGRIELRKNLKGRYLVTLDVDRYPRTKAFDNLEEAESHYWSTLKEELT